VTDKHAKTRAIEAPRAEPRAAAGAPSATAAGALPGVAARALSGTAAGALPGAAPGAADVADGAALCPSEWQFAATQRAGLYGWFVRLYAEEVSEPLYRSHFADGGFAPFAGLAELGLGAEVQRLDAAIGVAAHQRRPGCPMLRLLDGLLRHRPRLMKIDFGTQRRGHCRDGDTKACGCLPLAHAAAQRFHKCGSAIRPENFRAASHRNAGLGRPCHAGGGVDTQRARCTRDRERLL